jgi:hypothetical protein
MNSVDYKGGRQFNRIIEHLCLERAVIRLTSLTLWFMLQEWLGKTFNPPGDKT